jgi:hypothetical protein
MMRNKAQGISDVLSHPTALSALTVRCNASRQLSPRILHVVDRDRLESSGQGTRYCKSTGLASAIAAGIRALQEASFHFTRAGINCGGPVFVLDNGMRFQYRPFRIAIKRNK